MRCREFEQTVYIDGRPETMVGRACPSPMERGRRFK